MFTKRMRTIGIMGEKGGTGKTTTAVGLASEFARTGHAVVLIDIDRQETASKWCLRRTAKDMAVTGATVLTLREKLELARKSGAEIAIIDSPGKSDSAAIATAKHADLVLIPCRPRIFDIETIGTPELKKPSADSTSLTVRDLLDQAGNPPAFIVFNEVHPLATTSADEAKAMTAELTGLPVCPVHLSDLDIHGEAQAAGKGPQEIDPYSKAASELQRLCAFIKQQI